MSIKVKRRKLRNEKQLKWKRAIKKKDKYTIFEILEDVIDKCLINNIEITDKDDLKKIYFGN